MKTKQYSLGHIEAARALFPHRFKKEGWLDEQWTDEEINACKSVEMANFIKMPSLKTYPKPELLDFSRVMPDEFNIVNDYLGFKKAGSTFLSIGCGLGEKELRFAKNHPDMSFTAIDNAPYVESLNFIAEELGIRNIIFKKADIKKDRAGKYDVVYSFAVIYCVPDEYLTGYFASLMNSLNPDGVAFAGCSSYLNLIDKTRDLFPRSLLKRLIVPYRSGKQTGWQRDIGGIKKFLPREAKIDTIYYLDHAIRKLIFIDKSKVLCRTIEFTSKRVFPISNKTCMLVLRK